VRGCDGAERVVDMIPRVRNLGGMKAAAPLPINAARDLLDTLYDTISLDEATL
jgi:hypothetical protein